MKKILTTILAILTIVAFTALLAFLIGTPLSIPQAVIIALVFAILVVLGASVEKKE
jgi:hypothetical protein